MCYMKIVDQIVSNPSVLGIILGSVLSMTGVIITNCANDKRQRKQFLHDLEQKKQDREMILRKEVFLAATETIMTGTICMYNFCDLELPNEQVAKSYLEKLPALSKVNLIGNIETVKALLDYISAIDSTCLSLWIKRHPLIHKKTYLEVLEKQIENDISEMNNMTSMIRDMNIQGIRDDAKHSVLQNNYEFHRHRVEKNTIESQNIRDFLYKETLIIMGDCATASIELAKLLVPLLISARKELDLPLDEEKFTQIVDIVTNRNKQSVSSYINKVNPNIVKNKM
jgi:hypothetical protein